MTPDDWRIMIPILFCAPSRFLGPTMAPVALPSYWNSRAPSTKSGLSNEVWLTFFDAEDNGRLDGWDFIAGSTEMAGRLTVKPEMVVIADMVGDRDQQIYKEQNSTPQLVEKIWSIAARLGYDQNFLPAAKWSMLDDHTPFLQKGIAAVDLIDFDYPYWHTTQDTADKVAPESLERVGRVLQVLLEGE